MLKILARSVFINNFKTKIRSGYPLSQLIKMNPSELSIDPGFLNLIFNEDLYLVKEKQSTEYIATSASPGIAKEPVVEVKTVAKEKIVKKVAVVSGSQKEVETYNEFLSKILQAVGINWNEAGFISNDNKPTNEVYQSYLIFGLDNQKLINFNAPVFLNQPLTQDNQKFIFTYELSELEKNKEKKMSLWKAMQETYNLKK